MMFVEIDSGGEPKKEQREFRANYKSEKFVMVL